MYGHNQSPTVHLFYYSRSRLIIDHQYLNLDVLLQPEAHLMDGCLMIAYD